MHGSRLTGILIGTALALVLAAPVTGARAQSDNVAADNAAIDARVPMPDLTDDLPPPGLADVQPAAMPESKPAATAAAPAPEPAKVAEPAPAAAPPAPAQAAAPAASSEPVVTASAPAAAAPAVDPDDQAVSEKLSELIGDRRFERIVSGRKERAAMEAVYETRKHAPLWFEKGQPSARAKAAIARLAAADMSGLDPSDYKLPNLAAAATPEDRAEAELRFSGVVLAYARHAQAGRTVPSRISSNIEYAVPTPDPADVLMKIADSTDIAATLDGFEPPHAGYRALKKKLADVRGFKEDGPVRIPNGPVLKVGTAKKPTTDPRVPLLRERLKLGGDPADLTYDAKLSAAVSAFQKEAGLRQTGQLGPNTIEALNGSRKDRQVDAIIATMERWRWVPRDLGKFHVVLNIPDFTLKVFRDERVVWRTRVVVGKPQTPTPIFSSKIENILVNPTWHVPESIVYGEYLPAAESDPGVLTRMGLRVEQMPDGRIHITQPPGPGNALGRIKFNFANRFQVYQHDTPDKHLFAHERRAYSHGCMRVQNPDQYGEVLASYGLAGQGYTADRLTSMYGKGEAWLKFTNQVPVHLTYQTAYVDDNDKLVVREDLYNLDTRVLAALRGVDRNYGDVEDEMAAARRQEIAARRTQYRSRYAVQQPSSFERFLGQLFR